MSRSSLFRLARHMAAAGQLTLLVVGGGLGGHWLDGKFGTEPWLTLAGLVLGAGLGLFELGRVALGDAGPAGSEAKAERSVGAGDDEDSDDAGTSPEYEDEAPRDAR